MRHGRLVHAVHGRARRIILDPSLHPAVGDLTIEPNPHERRGNDARGSEGIFEGTTFRMNLFEGYLRRTA